MHYWEKYEHGDNSKAFECVCGIRFYKKYHFLGRSAAASVSVNYSFHT